MAYKLRSKRVIGTLFLIALLLNIVANEIINPILNNTNYLLEIYPNKGVLVVANLLNINCGIAMILIPIILMSFISKEQQKMAIGYVVFRAIEGVIFFYIAIKTLSLISVSKASLTNSSNTAFLSLFGQTIKAEIEWATAIYIIVYSCGAILFYNLLLKQQLVPKWLSIWGIIGVIVLLIGPIFFFLEIGVFKTIPLMEIMKFFAPPIALNELILCLWLLLKNK